MEISQNFVAFSEYMNFTSNSGPFGYSYLRNWQNWDVNLETFGHLAINSNGLANFMEIIKDPQKYGDTGCGVFKGGIKKINCIQMKGPNLEHWSSGELSKSAKIWLPKVNFLAQKSSESLIFFSLKNMKLGAHFLLLTFFDNINL